MISVLDALGFIKFSPDDGRVLAKLEASIDAALCKFDGGPITFEAHEEVPSKIAYALQRKYEAQVVGGSWRVQVDLKPGSSKFHFTPVVFALARRSESNLPAVVRTVGHDPLAKRVLVRMPTRSRAQQALSVLAAYRRMSGAPITIEVIIDEDDETMLAAPVQQYLAALDCVVTVGRHKSKIEACNAGRVSEWDILLLASDDMVPVADNYAVSIVKAMNEHFPQLDGAIYFDDGYQKKNCCTLPILGRRLYEQFGYVYEPAYRSLWCDAEQTEVLQAMGRLAYVPEKIIEHRHHVTGAKKDALYVRNDALWGVDEATYRARKAEGFYAPPLLFSICIASLPARQFQLERLVDQLWRQVLASWSRSVEILVDSGQGTIGEKRQRLLERARGTFVAYVDDDDGVSYDYVERILLALRSNPEADCASLTGVMTTAGEAPELFSASIAHGEWYSDKGVHYRTPNHLSPIRREHALKIGFKSVSHGEDHDYSERIYPLLKQEVSTGSRPLYMYWYMPEKKD